MKETVRSKSHAMQFLVLKGFEALEKESLPLEEEALL